MSELESNSLYPTLQLDWGREEYAHRINFNLMYPEYIKTQIFKNDNLLPKPTYLYKYFRPNDNSLKTLKEQYLYFSDPKDFGDEYDCLISDDEYINQIIRKSELNKNDLGVCCFCTVPNEDQMWDFYADGFKGFALKFKNNDRFLPYGKETSIKSHVMYLENNGPNNNNLIETLKSMRQKHVPEVVEDWQTKILYLHELYRKRKKYEFEKEYRAISYFATEFDRKIPFEKDNIDSIFIGNKMKKEYLKELKIILKSNKDIRVYQLYHNYSKQLIKFRRIKNINMLE